ncbi:MAG: 3'-5' exonuclease [Moraxella sp.]|nr:3'-5' exonuclease [Moraxella sp.]
MTAPILVFDIETIPDLATGRVLYGIDTPNDDDALSALIALRQAEAGHDFMRLPLHQVACLSFLWVENGQFTLRSLSLETMSEAEILSTFLRAFTKKPTIVSWNGANFDLPVLLYRMTHHKLNAHLITNAGVGKHDYLHRYSENHIDLMDKFSFGTWGNKQKLDTIASLCGFAGKGDVDGSQVVPMVKQGQWQKLTTYCESDVLNTWLVYLRWQMLTSKTNPVVFDEQIRQSTAFINTLTNPDGTPRHPRFL